MHSKDTDESRYYNITETDFDDFGFDDYCKLGVHCYGIKIKVYYHIWKTCNEIEQTMIFHSSEFGWMEYFDDSFFALFKTKNELIDSTYKNRTIFKKHGKIIYLGEL